jgi:Rha family phage regulatory protein
MIMTTELVFMGESGQAITNSLLVAKKFGKDHKHVLESIRKLMTAENSAVLQMFEESTYINEQNKTQPMYLMNRDGFTLLAMGFTGTKAMEFKIDYINAFNKMESKIKKSIAFLPDFTDPAAAAEAWAKEYKEKKVLAIENKKLEEENIQLAAENQELKHDKNYLDLIMRSKALLTVSQIAQDYGMSGKALNKKLADMGIQYSINGQWILYAKYKDCGYVSSRSIDITRADGRPDVVLHTEWAQAGRKFLYEELKKQGIIPMLERD